jgi:hypothetical protein
MKNKTQFVLLIGAFTLSSCAQILFRSEGRRLPHLETDRKINATIKKYKLPKDRLLFAHSVEGITKVEKFFKNTAEIYISDSNGYQRIYHEKNPTCPAPVDVYLQNICTNSPEWIDSSQTENNLSNALYKSDSTIFQAEISSFTPIYIAWTVGDHNILKKKLKWAEIISNLKDCKYEIYWINNDNLAKYYGYKRRKKIDIGPVWKMVKATQKKKS